MRLFRYCRFAPLLIIVVLVSCKHRSTAEFISVKAPIVALTHIRVIDGTGRPTKEDQTILIESGRITSIGPTADVSVPASATSLRSEERRVGKECRCRWPRCNDK